MTFGCNNWQYELQKPVLGRLVKELKSCLDVEDIRDKSIEFRIYEMELKIKELKKQSYGSNEDGWDLFEQQVREDFESIAHRKFSLVLTRDVEYPWVYADKNTEDMWRMYHKGHVAGREFEYEKR